MLELSCEICKEPYQAESSCGFLIFCPLCRSKELMKFRLDHFKQKEKEKECSDVTKE